MCQLPYLGKDLGKDLGKNVRRIKGNWRMVMFRTIKLIKFMATIRALASISRAAPATPSQAQTTCSIRLHIVKAGFIVGAGGGTGTLVCHGRGHPASGGRERSRGR